MKGIILPRKNIKKISKERLIDLYIDNKKSTSFIANELKCSENKINYWLKKYGISKRSISEAVYNLKNPLGDPFEIIEPRTINESLLFGLGLGLYWGEGTKRGKGSLRLSNSDPILIVKFIEFLEKCFSVDKNKLKFSIQIFNDISPVQALNFWIKSLKIKKSQFYKPIILKVRGKGTYKYKSKYGVVILYFNNIKIKRIICNMIENIHQIVYS